MWFDFTSNWNISKITLLKFSRVKTEDIFLAEDTSDIASKTVKNGLYTIVTQVLKFCLKTVSTVVLARLLVPDDFGLIAMVMVIINFAAMFKEAGLSIATIQQKSITNDQISSLFWINVLISLTIAGLIVLAAPIIARFYGRSELYPVTLLFALSFFISGFTIQHNALLKRLIRFDLIGIIDVGSRSIGLVCAIFFAFWNWGYYALVFNSLATTIAMALLTYFFFPWKPHFVLKGKGIKRMLLFGGDITGFNVINYFSRNADNLLIGKYIGGESLGLYSKAYSIFMMPIRQIRVPINSLTVPILSRLKNQPERYTRYCERIVEVLTIISLPITIVCYLEAGFIIKLMLGPGWEGATTVFKVLALIAPLQVILGIRGGIMVSMGYSKRYLKLGIVYAVFTVSAFIIGLSHGIEGVAIAYVTSQFILFIPSLFYSFHKTPFSVSNFFESVFPQIPIALISILIHFLIYQFVPIEPLKNIIGVLSILSVFIIFNAFRKKARKSVTLILNQIRK